MRYALPTLVHFSMPIIFKLFFIHIFNIYFYSIYNFFLCTYSVIIFKTLIFFYFFYFFVFRNTSMFLLSLFYFISISIDDGSTTSILICSSRLVEVLSHPQRREKTPIIWLATWLRSIVIPKRLNLYI